VFCVHYGLLFLHCLSPLECVGSILLMDVRKWGL